MSLAYWFLLIGSMLFLMGVTSPFIKRLPITTAILYLLIGIAIGPMFGEYFHFNPLKQAGLFEVITEIAVLISLYSAGLKLQAGMNSALWRVPLRLATIGVFVTIYLVTLLGAYLLDLPIGAAILLGAIIAPTDPVLATDIQVSHHRDRDRLRFSLTGEAGINDGTAFPFVMLGLGLLGLHELGDSFSRWILVDLVWATFIGIVLGGLLGVAAGFISHLIKAANKHGELLSDFIGLGLIGVVYGITLLCYGYGFLAVFVAAYALQQTEFMFTNAGKDIKKSELIASYKSNKKLIHESGISEYSLLFNEQLERLIELVLIILIGGMLFWDSWKFEYIIFSVVLFFIIRPLSVYIALFNASIPKTPLILSSWFGVRGIGSMYYLMYAIQHGLPEQLAVDLISVVLITVTLSIFIHGITVTPLMRWYEIRRTAWNKPLSTMAA